MEKSIDKIEEFLKTLDKEKLSNLENENVIKIAYLGDSIFDLFITNYLLKNYIDIYKVNELHKKNTSFVCAKSQARIIEWLINEKYLEQNEIDYYKHARNAHSSSKSKNSSIQDYRKATGFEALLGLLFLNNKIKRLTEIFNIIEKYLDKNI